MSLAASPIWQKGIKKLRFHLNRMQVPTSRYDLALLALRNRYHGRRCFVIGNGPSLRMSDLDLLAQKGELCLASNNIHLAFEATAWRPDYYGLEDTALARKYSEQINQRITGTMVVANYLADVIGPGPCPGLNRVFFRLLPRVTPPKKPAFSWNLVKGINCGGTITYTLLQIAAWLGCTQAYLLGVDFSYKTGAVQASVQHAGFQTYTYRPETGSNYFCKQYWKPGDPIIAPDLASSLCAFESAKAWCAMTGRMEIRNATRGGKLEVFPRVEFDSLF